MPKLAREYNRSNHKYSYSNNDNHSVIHAENHFHYEAIRRAPKRSRKKRNPVQSIIVLTILLFVLFIAMPFTFNNVTKAIFQPTPYQNITTDLENLAFPTHKYLSNAWSFGKRDFRYADDKNALMEELNENVSMPLLKSDLIDLAEIYPTVALECL